MQYSILRSAVTASIVNAGTSGSPDYRLVVQSKETGTANAVMRTRVFRSPSDFGARVVQGLLWLLIILMALSRQS